LPGAGAPQPGPREENARIVSGLVKPAARRGPRTTTINAPEIYKRGGLTALLRAMVASRGRVDVFSARLAKRTASLWIGKRNDMELAVAAVALLYIRQVQRRRRRSGVFFFSTPKIASRTAPSSCLCFTHGSKAEVFGSAPWRGAAAWPTGLRNSQSPFCYERWLLLGGQRLSRTGTRIVTQAKMVF